VAKVARGSARADFTAAGISCHRKDLGERLGNLLAVIDAIGGNTQRKRSDGGYG
jgi:hypothetical protein